MTVRKIRMLCAALALSLFAAAFGTGSRAVYAEEPLQQEAAEAVLLTGIAIGDLDAPEPGKTLDTVATVTSKEGITWNVPVIWADETGSLAVTAEAGRRYLPTIAFYVPAGYRIQHTGADGAFSVTLPGFYRTLYGDYGVIYAADPAKGFVYIIVDPRDALKEAFTVREQAAPVEAPAAAAQPAPAAESRPAEADPIPWEWYAAHAAEPAPETEPEEEESLVSLYCDPHAVDVIGESTLEWLVKLIKDTLEPQAANLLESGFGVFNDAAEKGELSEEIGLFIYYEKSNVYGETPVGALAYVSGGYTKNDVFQQYMAFDAKSFLVKEDETGEWRMDDSKKMDLLQTATHEMMHAYMKDFTRYGMQTNQKEGSFPIWFTEGMAVTVEGAYQFRAYDLGKLAENHGAFSEELMRYPVKLDYTDDSILKGYTATEGVNRRELFDIELAMDDSSVVSASYTSGYLACIYLGSLVAEKQNWELEKEDGTFDMGVMRASLGYILGKLHDGVTLDEVINDISGGAYTDTDSFTKTFIKGKGTEENGTVTYEGDQKSIQFINRYLTYLENASGEGPVSNMANGSVLDDKQSGISLIDIDMTTGSNVYKIPAKKGPVASTVDDNQAWGKTGGKSRTAADPAGNGQTAAAANAATDAEAAEAETEEPVTEEAVAETEEPAAAETDAVQEETEETEAAAEAEAEPAEEPAEETTEETAEEPVTEQEAEPETETGAEAEAPAEPAETEIQPEAEAETAEPAAEPAADASQPEAEQAAPADVQPEVTEVTEAAEGEEAADPQPLPAEGEAVPAAEEPATEEPATEAPAAEEPATEEPATEAPAAEEPAAEAPATVEPAAEEPAEAKEEEQEAVTDLPETNPEEEAAILPEEEIPAETEEAAAPEEEEEEEAEEEESSEDEASEDGNA